MENKEQNKDQFGELGLDAEIKLLEAELKELKKELAVCQTIVAKRDDRAKDYLIEIDAIKKDIEVVTQEIALLIEAKEEEELWEQETLEDGFDEIIENEGIDNEPEPKKEEEIVPDSKSQNKEGIKPNEKKEKKKK
jgi:hypothetical protein